MTEVTPQTRAARHLTQIVHMYADLSTEAVNRASSKDMPGGDAMVLLAPGADLAAYKYRQMSAIMGRIDVPIDDTEGDPDPVLMVLAYWANELRAERGEITDLPPTITRCADYIRQSLDWAFSDQAGEFDTEGLLTDLARLRTRMEAVLKQGYRPDRTEVPCLTEDCEATLNKEWHSQAKYDGYRCPQCQRFYDYDAFIRARADQLASRGAERFVPKQDAIDAIPRSNETVRKWIESGKVTTENRSGQVWVWWPDIRQLHLETPTRTRKREA